MRLAELIEEWAGKPWCRTRSGLTNAEIRSAWHAHLKACAPCATWWLVSPYDQGSQSESTDAKPCAEGPELSRENLPR